MYVVGAIVLSDFWKAHPESEAELRALHALLADVPPDALTDMLGGALEDDGTTMTVHLASVRVSFDMNAPSRVVRVTAVEPREAK